MVTDEQMRNLIKMIKKEKTLSIAATTAYNTMFVGSLASPNPPSVDFTNTETVKSKEYEKNT